MPVKAQTPQSDRMTTAKKGAKYGAESDDVLLCSYDQAPSAYRRTSVSHPSNSGRDRVGSSGSLKGSVKGAAKGGVKRKGSTKKTEKAKTTTR
eukprot:m.160178 g.160178  ORF g.160178 m.160178 type:complete len:93 (-) comp17621_c1_seq4:78-356(-)